MSEMEEEDEEEAAEPCDDESCSCECLSPPKKRTKRPQRRRRRRRDARERELVYYQCFCVEDEEEENNYVVRDEVWRMCEVRRHWCLREHCFRWLFPVRYPSLELCSRLGRYLWHERGSNRGPKPQYLKLLTNCIVASIRALLLERPKVEKLILCEQLIQAEWLNWYARKFFIKGLMDYIGGNKGMVMFSLEYARLARGEALGILFSLAKSSGATLKRLYLWDAFAYDQNPVQNHLTFEDFLRDSLGLTTQERTQMLCCHYLSPFYNLRVLSINYSYLADITGKTILLLGSVIRNSLRDLQILCLKNEVPNVHKAWESSQAYRIPDSSWMTLTKIAPKLRVSMVFGLEMERKRTWGVDMIFKTLRHFYAPTLVRVSVELHLNREQMDPVLMALPEELPNMRILEYTGLLYKQETMEALTMDTLDPEKHPNFCRLTLKIQMSNIYSKRKLEDLIDKLHLMFPNELTETRPGLLHVRNKVIRLEIFPL